MLGSAGQTQAMPILNDLGSKHTFYITSEWATNDQQSVSQVQNFTDFLGGERNHFRLDSMHLEVFFVGGIQNCDLPSGGGDWFSSGGSSRVIAFGSRSGHGGAGSYDLRDGRHSYDPEEPFDPEEGPPKIYPIPGPTCPISPPEDHGAPVPEPATMLLVGSGLAFLAGRRLRRKQPKG